jgi:hypothetical protein
MKNFYFYQDKINMIKPIYEKEWIGLSLAEAIEKAKSIDYVHRIVEEDGQSLMVPYDVKSNRVNLRLRDGKVTAVYTG